MTPQRFFRATLLVLAMAGLAIAARAQMPPPRPATPSAIPPGVVAFQAMYAATNKPVTGDVEWRIYSLQGGEPNLAASSKDTAPSFALTPGDYMVHVTHGLASSTKRVTMGAAPLSERLVISAGGLVVRAKLAEAPLAANRQAISVFIPQANDSEGKLVTNALKAGELLRLPEGTYHIVSTYAGSNSVTRADIAIQSGRVTEATMNHRAATMTLKLVRQVGGVALANTAWTVQTPGGDVIREALGAFPSLELAEGEYDVIARNEGREFKDKMKVVSGVNRDHEVIVR
jgi:hypothetical protein